MKFEDFPEVLGTKDMCALFRISRPSLLRAWRAGELPQPIRLGRKLVWPKCRIAEFLERPTFAFWGTT